MPRGNTIFASLAETEVTSQNRKHLRYRCRAKNPKFFRKLEEKLASWSTFKTMITYKANWYGKELILVGRNFPSSQRCSNCKKDNKAVKSLGVRTWKCPACGVIHDRDLNASKNIVEEAIRLRFEPSPATGLA